MDSNQKKHYQKIAKNYGLSGLSSIKDPAIRSAELEFIGHCIENYGKRDALFIDLGCGNGHTLKHLSLAHPKLKLHGLELSEDLYKLAKKQDIPDCELFFEDMTDSKCLEEKKFDIILTERSLINILKIKKRAGICEAIYNALNPGGIHIMIESFTESWINMNEARSEFQLKEIPVPDHNKYLNEDTIKMFLKKGFNEITHDFGRHYLSTHFYLTRIWHPAIRKDDTPVENSHFTKFFTQAFPPGIGMYSPIQFRLFKK